MTTDSAFWRDLEAQFRKLPHSIRLVGTVIDGCWKRYGFDGSTDEQTRRHLAHSFDVLGRQAGIAAGAPNRANAIKHWLNLLRMESPHFQGGPKSGWIQDLAIASAEYCCVCAIRAFELKASTGRAESVTRDAKGHIENPFRRGAKEHPKLLARWGSRQELWTFCEPSNEPADPEAERSFKEVVRIAFDLLRDSHDPVIRALTSTLREPYHVWLDFMRREKRGFVRREQVRTSHMGHFRAWLEVGTPLPPSATILFEDGDIQNVFDQSARFWDDLAVRAAEGGLPQTNRAGALEPAHTEAGSEARAARRAEVIYPILRQKGMSRSKWASKAGVDPSVVYDYLKGNSNPRPESRTALAGAIGLTEGALPE